MAVVCAARDADALTIKAMSEAASERLHNTPTVARNSYIHPAVIDLCEIDAAERDALFKRLSKTGGRSGLRAGEAELGAFLQTG